MFFTLNRFGKTLWHFLVWIKLSLPMINGLWHIFGLRSPRVTFFGGAKLHLASPYAQAATQLAALLAYHGISIITGGGAGIMEAAAIGAKKGAMDGGNGKNFVTNNLGIGVKGLEEGRIPSACSSFVRVTNFVMRKWLMTHFSSAFIVFPGGVGTYDELSEILTLMDTGKLGKHPMILYGKEYWTSFSEWVDDALRRGFVHPHIKEFFVIVDDIQTAYELICTNCAENK